MLNNLPVFSYSQNDTEMGSSIFSTLEMRKDCEAQFLSNLVKHAVGKLVSKLKLRHTPSGSYTSPHINTSVDIVNHINILNYITKIGI